MGATRLAPASRWSLICGRFLAIMVGVMTYSCDIGRIAGWQPLQGARLSPYEYDLTAPIASGRLGIQAPEWSIAIAGGTTRLLPTHPLLLDDLLIARELERIRLSVASR